MKTIIVLSSDDKADTANKIIDAAKENGMTGLIVNPNSSGLMSIKKEKLVIKDFKDKKAVEFDPKSTVIFVRGSALTIAGDIIVDALMSVGAFIINSKHCMGLCSNKMATHMVLSRGGVTTPRSQFIGSLDAVEDSVKAVGSHFPLILKVINGSQGTGVMKVESLSSLKSTAQALWDKDSSLMIQEFIKSDGDIRVLVLAGKVLGAMQRIPKKGEFRSNVSMGGKFKPIKLTNEQIKIAEKSAKAVGGFFVGVDIIGKSKNPLVIEVNGSPGSSAKYMLSNGKVVNGNGLITEVVKFVKDKSNHEIPNKMIGFVEWVVVDGKRVKARIDTGNTSFNSVHAKNVEISKDRKSVKYMGIDGKLVIKKIIRIQKIRSANDVVETRPVVRISFKFGKDEFKDELFTISDRGNNAYQVLVGNKFLSKNGYVVVSNKSFLLEDKLVNRLMRSIILS